MNHADSSKDVEDADAADYTPNGRMQEKHAKRLRQMDKKIVLLPEIGPGEIKEEGAHLQAKDDQNYAESLVHERESVNPAKQGSASGFLKRGDAIGDVTIVNITRIDLRKALERPFDITRRFLGNT